MINRNESFVEKESQWYRYRLSYSNVVTLSSYSSCDVMYMCFSHKKTEKIH